jgi:AraC family transcriptional regulator of adaptative response/methylated-DNA-[protein]-cysteine methyltransferase
VTSAIYDAGYGSSSRAYTAFRLPGMTPATYGRRGKGARIQWLTTSSPIGRILVAATGTGLCFVEVDAGGDDAALRDALAREFPEAEIDAAPSAGLRRFADAARAVAETGTVTVELPVDVRGTVFQWRVWRALTAVPRGETRTYVEVARAIGRPSASRAVARACATNPLALVVPCHRVVRADGAPSGYRWGGAVKRALLARER